MIQRGTRVNAARKPENSPTNAVQTWDLAVHISYSVNSDTKEHTVPGDTVAVEKEYIQ